MQHVTFSDLATRHGSIPALHLLVALEGLAQIKEDIISIDVETRFQKALHALCDINFAA